ncbi:MAG TPA: hypothetical protein VFV27_02090 [Nevskiaceae bacterium]|nr:hypothetical protein [Nevskiaceae bacterium]
MTPVALRGTLTPLLVGLCALSLLAAVAVLARSLYQRLPLPKPVAESAAPAAIAPDTVSPP